MGHGLLRVSFKVFAAMKRHHDHGNSYERKHLVGAGLQFRGLVHYLHGVKHGSMQAVLMLERELRVLYPDRLAARRERVTLGLTSAFETPRPTPY